MFHRTFKFFYYNFNVIIVASKTKRTNNNLENIDILHKMYEFSGSEIKRLFRKRKGLIKKEKEEMIESLEVCKKMGYSKEDILNYPSLVIKHPVAIINTCNLFNDIGCSPLDANLIGSSRRYLRNCVELLKTHGYLEVDANVVDRLLRHLDPPITKSKDLAEKLQVLDGKTLTEIHKAILTKWLKVRLNATDNDIIKLLRIHKMIKNKSFKTINENITLAESLGLSHEKILKCGYLLNSHPPYAKTMLEKYPYFAGVDFARAYKVNPKLIMVSPKRIMQIYNILKEYNIPDETIQRKPDVFTMSPVTLRERLDEVLKIPEWQMLDDPLFLKLVVHHKRIHPRLKFLKKFNLRCASLSRVSNLNKIPFENFMHSGKDVHSPTAVTEYFARLFHRSPKQIRERLSRHPYYCYVPFLDIKDTFNFLLNNGYSEDSIFKCIHILLYSSLKIQKTLNQLQTERGEDFFKLTQYKQLCFVLYHMEKEHHFSGNGIWRMELNAGSVDENTLE